MRYLLHTRNGRVLPWSPVWAARKDMVPCDKDGNRLSPAEPTPAAAAPDNEPLQITDDDDGFDAELIRPTADGEPVAIAECTTAVLSDYAERNFGEKIHHATKAENAQARVRELIAEHGHPDEPEDE